MRSFRLTRLRASLAPIAAAALALAPSGCGSDTEDPTPDTGVDVSDVSTDTSADASADASEDAGADATADAGTDAADEADAAPFVMELPSGNYAAAATSDPDTYVAVILGEDHSILAYACDSKTRGQWFTGNALSVPTVLSSTDYTGAESFLYLDLEDDQVVGSISAGADDAYPLTFALPKVEQPVLYRGSYAVTDQQALGGWIVLPDGSQRGLIVSTNPDDAAIADTIPIDTSKDRPSLQPQLVCDPNVAPLPASFTVTTCLPLRGCVSNTVSTDIRPQFNVVTFGDSFAAGEGAPEVNATGCPKEDSNLERLDSTGCTTDAVWASDPQAAYCHRSKNAGSALAVEKLRTEFPSLNIQFKSFACTGAKIADVISVGQTSGMIFRPVGIDDIGCWTAGTGCKVTSIDGNLKCECLFAENKAWPLDDARNPIPVPPQLEQLETFMAAKHCAANPELRDSLEGCWQGVDALVMGIGGNDAKFAEVLAEAFVDAGDDSEKINLTVDVALTATKRCDYGERDTTDKKCEVNDDCTLLNGVAGTVPCVAHTPLTERFDELDAALDTSRTETCAAFVPPASSRLLMELPDILSGLGSQPCTDEELNSAESSAPEGCHYSYIADIDDNESRLIQDLGPTVRAVFQSAAARHNWHYVTGVTALSQSRGVCRPFGQRFFNTVCDSLAQQGNDLLAIRTFGFADDLSMGMIHPNKKGFEGIYRDPIANALRAKILTKFAPIPPSNLRLTGVTKTVSGTGASTITTLTASLSWADRSSTESSFKFVPAVVGALNSEVVINSANRDGTGTASGTIVLKHAGSLGSVTVGLKACSEIGVCSDGPSLIVSGDIPAVALEPSTASTTTNASSAVTALVMWNQLTGPAVQFFEVEFYASSDSVRVSNAKLIHKQPLLANGGIPVATFATSTKIPISGKLRMRACNFTGCGPYSAIKSYPF